MAGHSKWKSIKHKKAIVDAKKGQAFGKVAREIMVAAKLGGASQETNSRLRFAIGKARDVNMPKDKVEAAIKKGTGELPGLTYEEMTIEGYGSGGIAILVEAVTDNRNRTSAELRSIFSNHNGNLAGAGSVSWQFQTKGAVVVSAARVEEERLMNLALEGGAEDIARDGELFTVTTPPQELERVKQVLTANQLAWESADLTKLPSSSVRVEDPAVAKRLLVLLDALEEHEDVQHVYANFDMPDALLAEHAAA